jgi:hypothetical protein
MREKKGNEKEKENKKIERKERGTNKEKRVKTHLPHLKYWVQFFS